MRVICSMFEYKIFVFFSQKQLCPRCIGGKVSGRTSKGIVLHHGRATSLSQNTHFIQFNLNTPDLVRVLTPDYCNVVASSD